MARTRIPVCFLLACLLFQGSGAAAMPGWYEKLSPQWGGHLKLRGTASWPQEDSLYSLAGEDLGDPWLDGYSEARVKNKVYFGSWGVFTTHYEAIFSGGDTRKAEQVFLKGAFGARGAALFPGPLNDDARLMDLTAVIDHGDEWICYHRLDRLVLNVEKNSWSASVGRQALTWGHGLVFNPMDILNPFSPTDIDRDYKIGADMAVAGLSSSIGAFTGVYVPRRNLLTGDVSWDSSALGGRWQKSFGNTEVSLVGVKDYEDATAGLGLVGYIGGACWRWDTTYTFLRHETPEGTSWYAALVANIDYSWVWKKKNWYGFVEFYANGLGDDDYIRALADPALAVRLARGQVFSLGKTYLSGNLQWEMTPLFNAYVTVINNLADPSGIIMPRCVWDATQNIGVTFGGTLYYGGEGSEYGGFVIPGTGGLKWESPPQAFLWVTWYF